MEERTDNLTRKVLESGKEGKGSRENVVMWGMAHSNALLDEEKKFKRLAVDGNSILAAGFETTGGTLAHLTYAILSSPKIHAKLVEELRKVVKNETEIPNWQILEKIPYFWAVVKEGLRVSVGAYSRLPRVNETQVMRYKGWEVPPGVSHPHFLLPP